MIQLEILVREGAHNNSTRTTKHQGKCVLSTIFFLTLSKLGLKKYLLRVHLITAELSNCQAEVLLLHLTTHQVSTKLHGNSDRQKVETGSSLAEVNYVSYHRYL